MVKGVQNLFSNEKTDGLSSVLSIFKGTNPFDLVDKAKKLFTNMDKAKERFEHDKLNINNIEDSVDDFLNNREEKAENLLNNQQKENNRSI